MGGGGGVSTHEDCRGPLTTSAAARAAGVMAVSDAYHLVVTVTGETDVFICGSAETMIDEAALAGFHRLCALSSFAGDARRAARPFDEARRGFGLSADALCVTTPRADGDGMMAKAFRHVDLAFGDVNYGNADATSMPLGEGAAAHAIDRAFADAAPSKPPSPPRPAR